MALEIRKRKRQKCPPSPFALKVYEAPESPPKTRRCESVPIVMTGYHCFTFPLFEKGPPITTSDGQSSQQSRGHYDTLGIMRSATLPEVRTAYRRRALNTHPDKGGRPEEFLRVAEAFEVLSDLQRRAQYDAELFVRACRDGQSVRTEGITEPETPFDNDKAARGIMRVAQARLLVADPTLWNEQLWQLSTSTLKVLSKALEAEVEAKRGSERRLLPEHEGRFDLFPREVPAPKDLPPGWKAVQFMYKTGTGRGKCYLRYQCPTTKRFHSSKLAAIRHDAELQGLDPDKAEEAFLARSPPDEDEQHQEASESRSRGRQKHELVQGCLYSRRTSLGMRYTVACNWASFRVSTGTTTSLEQALDWHIALAQIKAGALARMQAAPPNSIALPMTHEELIQLIAAEPDLRMNFHSCHCFTRFHMRNVATSTTHDHELVMRNYCRMTRMIRDSQTTKDMIREAQESMAQEAAMRSKELLDLSESLINAITIEFSRRQALGWIERRDRLPANSGSAHSLSRDLAPVGETVTPDPPHSQEPVETVAEVPRPRPGRGGRIFRPPVSPSQNDSDSASAALELKAALKLSNTEARDLASAVRLLPVALLRKRMEAFRTAIAAPRSLCRGRRRQRPPFPIQRRGPLSLSDGRPEVPALLAPVAVDLEAPQRREASRGGALSMTGFRGMPLGLEEAGWLTIVELSRTRATCTGAMSAADVEMGSRFKEFKYTPEFLEPHRQVSRSGRLVTSSKTMDGSEAALRLVRFFGHPRIAAMVERLDVSLVPVRALENRALQDVVASMPRLAHAVIPWHGWGSNGERSRFLGALQRDVNWVCVDARGSVQMRHVGG
eukprot:CAMPEP_0194481016 /NCGR_PEP_ID=MMETSP0253-20130528/3622_1 /TAXON_ID=2966 /ORGANISM="Noctiluca scintillans" /LENGTH=837 /DNA_ID=CAMNT_0039320471 /DNA_START=52 /DNA_END=2565 /DNA_ORIENTATION=+